MNSTAVAVFETQQEAQAALQALASEGFAAHQARVTSAGNDASPGSPTTPVESDKLSGSAIADFLGFGDEGETYAEAVRRGGFVVTVDAVDDEEASRAESAMARLGPVDIEQRTSEWRQSGWQPRQAGRARNLGPLPGGNSPNHIEAIIPVAEERLVVGKREVERGGVRIISRTVERPVEAEVTLREEHATITRRPVDRIVADADAAFVNTTVEVRETVEEPVVSKTARVVEEVQVGREAGIREAAVQDTVRKTEVDIQPLAKTDSAREKGGL